MKIFNNMSLIISAIGGFIVFYLGGYDNLLITIVTLTVLDWLTGLTKSLYDKKLSSKIGFKGIAKTIGMFLLIASTVAIQNIIEKNIPIREITIMFYIANQGISIIENLSDFLPIPDKIKDYFLQIRGEENF